MHNGPLLAELIHLAGHAVVEAHPKRQQQIGSGRDLLHRVGRALARLEFAAHRPVRVSGTVHPQPAQRQGVRLRERAAAHDGRRHRDLRGFDKPAQLLARVAGDNAAAHIKHRPLGFLDQPDDFIQLQVAGPLLGVVAPQVDRLGENRLRARLLHVLRQVNEHRPGPAGLRDVKRLFDNARNVVDIGNQIAVLHHRQSHAVDVRLLKRALADHRLRHLAGDGDERDGIHVSIGDTRDQVGRTRTAGGHAHPGPPGHAPVAPRGKRPALLMPRQDRADLLRARQRLVDLHAGAARVRENRVHPFPFEAGHKDFAAGHRGSKFHVLASGRFLLRFSCLAHRYCGYDWLPQVHKKTHDRSPAVGFCRNSSYLRQAPTASPTTTTSRVTCRMFTIIAANLVNPARDVKPLFRFSPDRTSRSSPAGWCRSSAANH